MGVRREKRYSSTLSLTSALDEGGGWSTRRPGRFTTGDKTRCPLYMRLGGPQGRSGRARKILAPTGIRSLDRSSRSKLLYGLRHSGPIPVKKFCLVKKIRFLRTHILTPHILARIPLKRRKIHTRLNDGVKQKTTI